MITTIKLDQGDSWYKVGNSPKEIKLSKTEYQELWKMHPKDLGKVKICGRVIDTPRYQESYGESYYYTGINHPAKEINHPAKEINHPFLDKLLKWVRNDSGKNYTQMLINWYVDGNHYIGPHSDDTRQLEPNSAIYSFSFGQTRDFVIQSKDKTFRKVIPVKNNMILVMGGEMQKYYKHSVPKRKNATMSRINITFRLFKN